MYNVIALMPDLCQYVTWFIYISLIMEFRCMNMSVNSTWNIIIQNLANSINSENFYDYFFYKMTITKRYDQRNVKGYI